VAEYTAVATSGSITSKSESTRYSPSDWSSLDELLPLLLLLLPLTLSRLARCCRWSSKRETIFGGGRWVVGRRIEGVVLDYG